MPLKPALCKPEPRCYTTHPVSSPPPRLLIGTCNLTGPQTDYYRTFSCVEIDSTLYQLPKLTTAARWRTAAPSHFQFTLKAWQVITHPPHCATHRRTRLDPHDRQACGHFGFNATIRWAWDRTRQIAETLDAPLVLFQTPPAFAPGKENLARFRQFFERANRGRLHFAWEPRGAWPAELIADLCRELNLIHATDPFEQLPASPRPLQYFRLCRPPNHQRHYTAADWSQLRHCCDRSRQTFCLFNHPARLRDAQRFATFMAGSNA